MKCGALIGHRSMQLWAQQWWCVATGVGKRSYRERWDPHVKGKTSLTARFHAALACLSSGDGRGRSARLASKARC